MANETPATVTMNISLPQSMKRYIDEKVSAGIYGSVSEFVRELIREKYQEDQEKASVQAELLRKVREGFEGKNWIEFDEKYGQRLKNRLAARMKSSKAG